MKVIEEKGKLYLYLVGKIDASNAPAMELELSDALSAHPGLEPVLDAEGLEYISSAGLRVLLRLQKRIEGKITVRNVSAEVYNMNRRCEKESS